MSNWQPPNYNQNYDNLQGRPSTMSQQPKISITDYPYFSQNPNQPNFGGNQNFDRGYQNQPINQNQPYNQSQGYNPSYDRDRSISPPYNQRQNEPLGQQHSLGFNPGYNQPPSFGNDPYGRQQNQPSYNDQYRQPLQGNQSQPPYNSGNPGIGSNNQPNSQFDRNQWQPGQQDQWQPNQTTQNPWSPNQQREYQPPFNASGSLHQPNPAFENQQQRQNFTSSFSQNASNNNLSLPEKKDDLVQQFQSSTKKLQQSLLKESKLSVIKAYMEQNKVPSLDKLFTNVTLVEGHEVVSKQEFITFVVQPSVGITQADADSFCLIYEEPPGSGNLNISRMKTDMEALSSSHMSLEKANTTVQQVYEMIKRELSKQEINLQNIIKSEKGDGLINKMELKMGLSKIIMDVKEEYLEAIFLIFDQQSQGVFNIQEFIHKLYEHINKKKIQDPTHQYFSYYEKIRKHMEDKRVYSVSSILLVGSNKRADDYEVSEFLDILKKIVMIEELKNPIKEQKYCLSVMDQNSGKLDYEKFADSVGYSQPQQTALLSRDLQKEFYRKLLKSNQGQQNQFSIVERLDVELRRQDTRVEGVVHVSQFMNILIMLCDELKTNIQLIEKIAYNFSQSYNGFIKIQEFMDKIKFEQAKLKFLRNMYKTFYETLDFKGMTELYTLFQPYDKRYDKKFDKEQIRDCLAKRGITVTPQELEYLFQEYSPEYNDQTKSINGFISFIDIEKDYREFYYELLNSGQIKREVNLQDILRIMRTYLDLTGKTLRQEFNKTKVNESDLIDQYTFSKTLDRIARGANRQIEDGPIHRFKLELITNNQNAVSFSELLKVYNQFHGIREDDERQFIPQLIEQLQTYIAQIALQKKGEGFLLKQHFMFPSSTYSQFQQDLNKEPLGCRKNHTQQTIDEMTRKYQDGSYINTQLFLVDIQEKLFQQERRGSILKDLKKQVQLKNLKIEDVFQRAMPELHKFNIEFISPEEFKSIFLFVEYKIEVEKVREMLNGFLSPDHQGKFSYLEFIKEFNALDKNNPARGKKLVQTVEEMMKRIAYFIDQRGVKNMGTLLADQDLKGDNTIQNDSFYRTLDSYQMGLGEVDITELIRYFKKDDKYVDLIKFRDEINSLITNPVCKIQLKTVLNELVKERVVENIELSPRSMNNQKDAKEILKHLPLVKDIQCGLCLKGLDAITWFSKYQSFVKGSLTSKEYLNALEALDVQCSDSSLKQSYYDFIISRQEAQLGYKSQMVLIEHLSNFLNKDCPSSRDQLCDEIIQDIALQLTENRIPILTAFTPFDKGDGFIFKQDFVSMILDNYLRLSQVLTYNKKALLGQKYTGSEGQLRFQYQSFIDDLKRKEMEQPRKIKIFMTQAEVDFALSHPQPSQFDLGQQIAQTWQVEQPKIPDLPAQSRKNTVCTEHTQTRNLKLATIPTFQFDDIMLETFKKGLAVETYFKKFGTQRQATVFFDKNQFTDALQSLNLKWANQIKIGEMFDAIDMGINQTFTRQIRMEDIGEAVYQNALYTVDDFQAKVIESIYNGLKQRQMLGKLKDLFIFYNTRRDNTCQAKEFKDIFNKLNLSNESDLDLIIFRYRSMQDSLRVEFTQFLRDIEYCDKGIKPQLIWAINIAEDMIKSFILLNYNTPEQFFAKYTKLQGIITYDEFRRSIDELQIGIYYDEEYIRSFFSNVFMAENQGTLQNQPINNFSKVNLSSLCDLIKKLSQKTMGQIYAEILEKIFIDSKRINLTYTVYTIFTEYDPSKTGHVHFQDFRHAIEEKLNAKSIKPLDLQVLAKRYKSDQRGMPDDMVQYEKFYLDYEKLEKYGLKAAVDPLRGTGGQLPGEQKVSDVPPEVKKIYSDIAGYCMKLGIIDKLCDDLVSKDDKKIGMVSDQAIFEVYRAVKMTINKKQLNFITYPLFFDNQGNYNYVSMIERLFGPQKAQDVIAKYQLKVQATMMGQSQRQPTIQNTQRLEISQKFKDQIEIKYQALTSIVHQVSKGSLLLREQEYINSFKKSGIVMLSSDVDLLLQTFHQLKNPHTQAIDFRSFTRQYNIRETSSLLLLEIQKQLGKNNIRVEDQTANFGQFISEADFKLFIETSKLDIKSFTQDEIKEFFDQIAERKDKLDKGVFIRLMKNESDDRGQQEWLPYIVNEFVYHVCNNNIDLFKIVSPQAKKLTLEQFKQTLQQMKYIPSNPKELPSLYTYFAIDADKQYISIEKVLDQIRKINPNYAISQVPPKQNLPGPKSQTLPQTKPQPSKQISLFTNKIKAIFYKINEQLRKNGVNPQILYQQIDSNKNGLLEKQEFLTFFTKDMIVKGITLSDLELLFDALDTNKDGCLSVNEFCLCIEGIQLTKEQRLKSFDPELEKEIISQILLLFNVFDSNQDGQISFKELQDAMRSINPTMSTAQIEDVLRQSDKDNNKAIDKQEFINMLLPKYKEELIMFESNLEDLRILFKECDLDHSNYLDKKEMQQALRKLGVELTEVQMEDLMKELDLDENQHIDIDEFIAFLSIADQIKFRNPANKTNVVKIRHARKLQAVDFYNCFKNLPQSFLPSFTTELFEKRMQFTPSHGIYPEFDSRTLTYKDISKLDSVNQMTQQQAAQPQQMKKFIDMYQPHLACEIQIEECSGVPLPKKDDFDWTKITHRELRVVLFDQKTQEFLSNTFIIQAAWKPEYEGKWLFNTSESLNQARNALLRTDLLKQINAQAFVERDLHLLFELVLIAKIQETQQQVTCSWGSLPANQLDKTAKHKIVLKGGSPFIELKIDQADIHQEKKGFSFLKKVAANTDDQILIVNIRPFVKFSEQTQFYISMLPSTCIISKRLLSFVAAFRLYCYRKLAKYQQLMTAPAGNFVIAQFKKVFDNPDVQILLGDCWEQELKKQNLLNNIDGQVKLMEDFMMKMYSIVYSADFKLDHIFPTRSSSYESDLFAQREQLIKTSLITGGKYTSAFAKQKKKAEEKVLQPITNFEDDYKPFNIAEMDIKIGGLDSYDNKQDELLKMYQQMGLIQ